MFSPKDIEEGPVASFFCHGVYVRIVMRGHDSGVTLRAETSVPRHRQWLTHRASFHWDGASLSEPVFAFPTLTGATLAVVDFDSALRKLFLQEVKKQARVLKELSEEE